MALVRKILLVVLILLSFATGITKLIQMPAEMDLFQGVGWPVWLTLAFGAVQVAGGALLVSMRTRPIGAWIMIATFAIASIVVFQAGMLVFGLVSLLFIVLAAVPLLPGSAPAREKA